jgi:hypothetical protein
MTKTLAAAALLLIAALLPSARGANRVAPSIGVFFDFSAEPDGNTVAAMQREVATIMAPTGLLFSWRPLNANPDQPEGNFADLVVIHFKGLCNALYMPPSELGPPVGIDTVLASTQTSHGQVLHFTDVNCTEVRNYLASETSRAKKSQGDELYGRALGRIVAHEMYHIFAATEKHGSDGVARAYFSRRNLVQPVFGFLPRESAELREFGMRAFMAPGAHPVN